MKRTLSLVLSLIMILGIFASMPVIVNAATSGTTGSCTWKLDGTVLTISGNGNMEDYGEWTNDYGVSHPYDAPWGRDITKIIINDGVTGIGDYAFFWCSDLTSISIPDSVRSIRYSAFSNCTSLTSITIPDSVTSIGGDAFSGCTSLTSISIPDSVTFIDSSAFYNTAIYNDVSNWNNEALYIDNLLVVVKPSVTEGYSIKEGTETIASAAFKGCTSLTSITIPDSVTSIGGAAFSNCTNLTSVEIPDSVTNIPASAFSGCTSLASITIPDSVTSIGYDAFSGCTNLTSVTIPDSVISIGGDAFSGCTSLASITIPDSVTSIGYDAFSGCTSLTAINVDANNPNFTSFDDVLFSKEKTSLIKYPVGKTNISYTIPDSVTSIGDSAFSGCTSLTSISIPDSVTSIGYYAFFGCTSLTSITIPDSVTNISDSAFSGCTSLTSISIPDSVTSIGENAFYNTGYYNNSVNWENNVLYVSNHLIEANSSLSGAYEIKDGTKTIADYAFSGCNNLTSISFPKSVQHIGECIFGVWRWGYSGKLEYIDFGFCRCLEYLRPYINDGSGGDIFDRVNCYYADCIPDEGYVYKEPTCTQEGFIDYYCVVGGNYIYTDYIPATGHTEAPLAATNPTCTKPGLSEGTHCSVCGEVFVAQTETAPPTGHTEGDWIIDTDSTCTAKGTKHTECTVCGVTISTGEIYEKPHQTQWLEIEAPTCSESGKRVKKCTVCNNEIEVETIPASGHTAGEWIIDKEATCTENGSMHTECTVCGDILDTSEVVATNHTPSEWIIDVAATCTETGSKHIECTVCGETLDSSEIVATGHKAGDWIIDTEATCTEKGSQHKECTVCGDTLDTSELVTTDHVAGEWIVDIEATSSAPGSKHKECTVCGEVLETATIPQLKPATPKVTTTNEIGGVQVSWNKVEGATKYVVYRRQGGSNSWVNVGTTTGNTLLDKNVKSGIYYVYSVRAYNASGTYSDFVSANTQTRKYMATPKLTTIYNHVNGLAIKWNAVDGITNGYRVYRRGAGSTYWTYLGTTKNLYFIDSQVKNKSGEYFRYTVIADGDYHSKFDTTGLYLKRLANPTLTSAVSSTAGITVKWGAVKGTTGYYVYRKTGNSTWVRIATVGGTNTTSYVDTTAKKGVTYTYTVKAVYGATTSAYNSGISCKDKY